MSIINLLIIIAGLVCLFFGVAKLVGGALLIGGVLLVVALVLLAIGSGKTNVRL